MNNVSEFARLAVEQGVPVKKVYASLLAAEIITSALESGIVEVLDVEGTKLSLNGIQGITVTMIGVIHDALG